MPVKPIHSIALLLLLVARPLPSLAQSDKPAPYYPGAVWEHRQPADSGVDAGQLVKAAVTASGGRGGGNARMAPGSVPTVEALSEVVVQLTS